MDRIVIYGIGDFAKTLSSYIEEERAYEIVAYVVDAQYLPENLFVFNRKPLISLEDYLEDENYKNSKILLAIGYSNMRARKKMFEKALNTGREIVNFLSEKATIHGSVKFGVGNIVFPNTVIEPNTIIGNNNIFWSSVNISHDVIIGSHSFFASQSLLGGFCKVNNNCFFGFNSTVLQNVVINDEALIGACSLVSESADSFGKYIGVPAVLVSTHQQEGIRIK